MTAPVQGPPKKVVFVTGATSGIGAATVKRLARAGHTVYGVSRSGAGVDLPADHGLPNVTLRAADVRDSTSIERVIQEIVTAHGRLDAVVNSAAIVVAGTLEAMPIDVVREQFDINLFGLAVVFRAAAPALRRSAPSVFVQLSSVAAHVALPYQSAYCAGKAGGYALCEALRYEFEPQGVRIALVEPGNSRTPVTQNRKTFLGDDALRSAVERALKINDEDERRGIDPDNVAECIERIIVAKAPPLRRLVGHWHERVTPLLHHWLPRAWFRGIISAHYRL